MRDGAEPSEEAEVRKLSMEPMGRVQRFLVGKTTLIFTDDRREFRSKVVNSNSRKEAGGKRGLARL